MVINDQNLRRDIKKFRSHRESRHAHIDDNHKSRVFHLVNGVFRGNDHLFVNITRESALES